MTEEKLSLFESVSKETSALYLQIFKVRWAPGWFRLQDAQVSAYGIEVCLCENSQCVSMVSLTWRKVVPCTLHLCRTNPSGETQPSIAVSQIMVPCVQGNGKTRLNLVITSFLSSSSGSCSWASWLVGAWGVPPIHGVWSGQTVTKKQRAGPSQCICVAFLRTLVSCNDLWNNGALFALPSKWTRCLATFEMEGAEWEELKALSVGCQGS